MVPLKVESMTESRGDAGEATELAVSGSPFSAGELGRAAAEAGGASGGLWDAALGAGGIFPWAKKN